jgi:hypothetical protein
MITQSENSNSNINSKSKNLNLKNEFEPPISFFGENEFCFEIENNPHSGKVELGFRFGDLQVISEKHMAYREYLCSSRLGGAV